MKKILPLERIKRLKLKLEPSTLCDEQSPTFGQIQTCHPLDGTSVADVVVFHAPISIGSAKVSVTNGDVQREIACTPILSARLGLGIDVHFRQIWRWLKQRLGSPQLTLSLAPCEERTIEVSNTKRRSINESRRSVTETTSNRETSDSFRSSTDVTQTSSHNVGWSAATNSSVGINYAVDVSIGNEFTLQGAVDETTTEGMQTIQEETNKSAEQLRSMQEIKIETTEEDIVRRTEKRVIKNCYRDRSQTLNFFSVIDVYEVLMEAKKLSPALWLRFDSLDFDRQFVLANAGFLEATLLDGSLAIELSNAVAAARQVAQRRPNEEISRVVADAFDILLEQEHGVFRDFDESDSNEVVDQYRLSVSLDAEQHPAGLGDAFRHGFGRSFTAICGVHSLRRRNQLLMGAGSITSKQLQQRDLELCLALSDTIETEWRKIGNTHIRDMFDDNNNTEVIRRVSTFRTIVEGVLRPMLGGVPVRTRILDFVDGFSAEENLEPVVEREIDEKFQEAEHLVYLVVEHIKCHEDYYRIAYLRNLFEATSGKSFRSVLTDLIFEVAGGEIGKQLVEIIDWSSAHLDRDSYVVGFRAPFLDDVPLLLDNIATDLHIPTVEGGLGHLKMNFAEGCDIVEVPGLGTHIEPFAGTCVLPDVPECSSASLNTELSMKNC